MKKKIVIISILGLVIDQLIKLLILPGLKINIIPNFLSFIYTENKGVAFSMLNGNKIFIITLSVILLFCLLYMLNKDYLSYKKDSLFKDITYGFLIGGILGNLIDRIVRGYVIDYISFNIFGYLFPIFNVADILITIGVILMIIDILKEDEVKAN